MQYTYKFEKATDTYKEINVMSAGDDEDENVLNHNKTNKPVRLANPSFDLIIHTVSLNVFALQCFKRSL